jgi:hypothetical protein
MKQHWTYFQYSGNTVLEVIFWFYISVRPGMKAKWRLFLLTVYVYEMIIYAHYYMQTDYMTGLSIFLAILLIN